MKVCGVVIDCMMLAGVGVDSSQCQWHVYMVGRMEQGHISIQSIMIGVGCVIVSCVSLSVMVIML